MQTKKMVTKTKPDENDIEDDGRDAIYHVVVAVMEKDCCTVRHGRRDSEGHIVYVWLFPFSYCHHSRPQRKRRQRQLALSLLISMLRNEHCVHIIVDVVSTINHIVTVIIVVHRHHHSLSIVAITAYGHLNLIEYSLSCVK